MNSLDLSFVEHLIVSCYHQAGPGRPPRNPLGLFKAYLTRRYLRMSSLRDLERRLCNDERLRAICNIGREEPAYGRTVLSRFNQRLGARRLREAAQSYGIKAAIPYPANQKPKSRNILRVTSDFRTHGPESLKRIYRKRSIIELAFASLKEHLNLNSHKVRGFENVTIHVSYCILCLLYTIEASHNTKHPSKTRSITYWAN